MEVKEKDEIVAEARKLIAENLPERMVEAGCLYHSIAVSKVLSDRGYPSVIVGGSCSWQFTRYDNGKNPTHFSYTFTPGVYIPESDMPEMHIWVDLCEKNEIVDISTKYLPAQAKRMIKIEFDEELSPPDYYWGDPTEENHRFSYEYDKLATVMANEFAMDCAAEFLTGRMLLGHG